MNTDFIYWYIYFQLSGGYCYIPWGYHLNVPLISIVTLPFLLESMYEPSGMSMNPATDPSINSAYAAPMNFFERLSNWIEICQFKYVLARVESVSNVHVKKYFGPNVPQLEELVKDMSLVLLNHNFALNEVRPLAPKVVPVGGLHIVESNDTLKMVCRKKMLFDGHFELSNFFLGC